MSNLRVSIIQMKVKSGDPDFNRARAIELIEKSAIEKPDVIVLPEMWTTGYQLENIAETSDTEGEPTLGILSNAAKKLNVNILAGSIANKVNNKIYNSSFYINRYGEIVANYNKVHLFKLMNEDKYLSSGENICIFDLDGVKCGLMICYDLRFPELARKLTLMGIKILFIPAQWPSVRIEHWNTLLRARAIENQIFIIACNVAGNSINDEFNGNSAVISPTGDIIRKLDHKEQIVCSDIDLGLINDVKAKLDYLLDRRPDIY